MSAIGFFSQLFLVSLRKNFLRKLSDRNLPQTVHQAADAGEGFPWDLNLLFLVFPMRGKIPQTES
jgi:hypothetical protein